MDKDYKLAVNDILGGLLNDILRVEHRAIAPDTLPLSMSELHIIEAVGSNDGKYIMSDIARKLDITLPTLTAAADRLEEKGFILRHRCTQDRRRVSVSLTEEGKAAYHLHASFHEKMVDAFIAGLEQTKMPELLEGMVKLRNFLKEQTDKMEMAGL